MRSRVIPGSSVTIARRVPVRRLKSVDLPTFGRPTITSDGSFSPIFSRQFPDTVMYRWLSRQRLCSRAINFNYPRKSADVALAFMPASWVSPNDRSHSTASAGILAGSLRLFPIYRRSSYSAPAH